jgi:hypothetical protein
MPSNITSNILYFRIEMNYSNKQAKFFWKDDESKSWQQLGTSITMGYDWKNGTFQGEQSAILNFNPNGSTGYVDVDWFRLNDKQGESNSQGDTGILGDLSSDGHIDALDFVLLKKYLLGNITVFPGQE